MAKRFLWMIKGRVFHFTVIWFLDEVEECPGKDRMAKWYRTHKD